MSAASETSTIPNDNDEEGDNSMGETQKDQDADPLTSQNELIEESFAPTDVNSTMECDIPDVANEKSHHDPTAGVVEHSIESEDSAKGIALENAKEIPSDEKPEDDRDIENVVPIHSLDVNKEQETEGHLSGQAINDSATQSDGVAFAESFPDDEVTEDNCLEMVDDNAFANELVINTPEVTIGHETELGDAEQGIDDACVVPGEITLDDKVAEDIGSEVVEEDEGANELAFNTPEVTLTREAEVGDGEQGIDDTCVVPVETAPDDEVAEDIGSEIVGEDEGANELDINTQEVAVDHETEVGDTEQGIDGACIVPVDSTPDDEVAEDIGSEVVEEDKGANELVINTPEVTLTSEAEVGDADQGIDDACVVPVETTPDDEVAEDICSEVVEEDEGANELVVKTLEVTVDHETEVGDTEQGIDDDCVVPVETTPDDEVAEDICSEVVEEDKGANELVINTPEDTVDHETEVGDTEQGIDDNCVVPVETTRDDEVAADIGSDVVGEDEGANELVINTPEVTVDHETELGDTKQGIDDPCVVPVETTPDDEVAKDTCSEVVEEDEGANELVINTPEVAVDHEAAVVDAKRDIDVSAIDVTDAIPSDRSLDAEATMDPGVVDVIREVENQLDIPDIPLDEVLEEAPVQTSAAAPEQTVDEIECESLKELEITPVVTASVSIEESEKEQVSDERADQEAAARSISESPSGVQMENEAIKDRAEAISADKLITEEGLGAHHLAAVTITENHANVAELASVELEWNDEHPAAECDVEFQMEDQSNARVLLSDNHTEVNVEVEGLAGDPSMDSVTEVIKEKATAESIDVEENAVVEEVETKSVLEVLVKDSGDSSTVTFEEMHIEKKETDTVHHSTEPNAAMLAVNGVVNDQTTTELKSAASEEAIESTMTHETSQGTTSLSAANEAKDKTMVADKGFVKARKAAVEQVPVEMMSPLKTSDPKIGLTDSASKQKALEKMAVADLEAHKREQERIMKEEEQARKLEAAERIKQLQKTAEELESQKKAQEQALKEEEEARKKEAVERLKKMGCSTEEIEARKEAQAKAIMEEEKARKLEAAEKLKSLELARLAQQEKMKKELEERAKADEEKLKRMREEKEAARIAAEEELKRKAAEAEEARKKAAAEHGMQFYSLDELKIGIEGVEYATREQYLSPTDFHAYFGMTKEDFIKLKPWKRNMLKKNIGLW